MNIKPRIAVMRQYLVRMGGKGLAYDALPMNASVPMMEEDVVYDDETSEARKLQPGETGWRTIYAHGEEGDKHGGQPVLLRISETGEPHVLDKNGNDLGTLKEKVNRDLRGFERQNKIASGEGIREGRKKLIQEARQKNNGGAQWQEYGKTIRKPDGTVVKLTGMESQYNTALSDKADARQERESKKYFSNKANTKNYARRFRQWMNSNEDYEGKLAKIMGGKERGLSEEDQSKQKRNAYNSVRKKGGMAVQKALKEAGVVDVLKNRENLKNPKAVGLVLDKLAPVIANQFDKVGKFGTQLIENPESRDIKKSLMFEAGRTEAWMDFLREVAPNEVRGMGINQVGKLMKQRAKQVAKGKGAYSDLAGKSRKAAPAPTNQPAPTPEAQPQTAQNQPLVVSAPPAQTAQPVKKISSKVYDFDNSAFFSDNKLNEGYRNLHPEAQKSIEAEYANLVNGIRRSGASLEEQNATMKKVISSFKKALDETEEVSTSKAASRRFRSDLVQNLAKNAPHPAPANAQAMPQTQPNGANQPNQPMPVTPTQSQPRPAERKPLTEGQKAVYKMIDDNARKGVPQSIQSILQRATGLNSMDELRSNKQYQTHLNRMLDYAKSDLIQARNNSDEVLRNRKSTSQEKRDAMIREKQAQFAYAQIDDMRNNAQRSIASPRPERWGSNRDDWENQIRRQVAETMNKPNPRIKMGTDRQPTPVYDSVRGLLMAYDKKFSMPDGKRKWFTTKKGHKICVEGNGEGEDPTLVHGFGRGGKGETLSEAVNNLKSEKSGKSEKAKKADKAGKNNVSSPTSKVFSMEEINKFSSSQGDISKGEPKEAYTKHKYRREKKVARETDAPPMSSWQKIVKNMFSPLKAKKERDEQKAKKELERYNKLWSDYVDKGKMRLGEGALPQNESSLLRVFRLKDESVRETRNYLNNLGIYTTPDTNKIVSDQNMSRVDFALRKAKLKQKLLRRQYDLKVENEAPYEELKQMGDRLYKSGVQVDTISRFFRQLTSLKNKNIPELDEWDILNGGASLEDLSTKIPKPIAAPKEEMNFIKRWHRNNKQAIAEYTEKKRKEEENKALAAIEHQDEGMSEADKMHLYQSRATGRVNAAQTLERYGLNKSTYKTKEDRDDAIAQLDDIVKTKREERDILRQRVRSIPPRDPEYRKKKDQILSLGAEIQTYKSAIASIEKDPEELKIRREEATTYDSKLKAARALTDARIEKALEKIKI